MLRLFTITLNMHPALAANPVYNFSLPFDAQLVAVSYLQLHRQRRNHQDRHRRR